MAPQPQTASAAIFRIVGVSAGLISQVARATPAAIAAPLLRQMQTTDELSPRQAAEVFTALRFWARATRYNAEEAERVLLAACESRSNRNWVLGAATGALAGLAVGLQLKQPRVQTASLAAIASTFGSRRSLIPI